MGKHIPRAQAQEGDLIFWGTDGDCVNNVAHVGIFIKDGLMINAAHTGTPVREQSIWTSSGGESICDDAVRYVLALAFLNGNCTNWDMQILLRYADSSTVAWAVLICQLSSSCTFVLELVGVEGCAFVVSLVSG
jgi:hypothetical protein